MRNWIPPQLIVLVRGKPEEAVLDACKQYPFSGTGPSDNVVSCSIYVAQATCDHCNTASPS